ncbi:MAG: type II toxin-antitoxin system MqsA family antitoxin [Firmicutes bacterium]|nr:type II toxin-antitoxin system MqsA family antitoxin [Bacillota bacterium]
MKCHVCGGVLEPTESDLPFKVGKKRIVIVRQVPVFQCNQCGTYLLEDSVMRRVEATLAAVDANVELGVVSYAA